MPRYTNNLVVVSSNGKYAAEMNRIYREYINSLEGEYNDTNIRTFVASERIGQQSDYTHSDILKDYGKGRISSGLKSLELLSILCSGVSHEDLFMFDRTIYYGDVYNFKNSSDEEMLASVLANMGMQIYIDNLPTHTAKDYRDLCLQIAKHVGDGTFVREQYKTYVLKESKRMVKLYLGILK